MASQKQYFSTSLEKGLKILALFNKDTQSVTQTEVSKALNLNMTSTYRYINTFVELGYLHKDPETKRLSPGIRCMTLCFNLMQATDNMRLMKMAVDKIFDERKITTDVVFVMDDILMRVYHREAEEILTYNLPNIGINCLHNTSVGKIYLSQLSEEELKLTLDRTQRIRKTEKSIVNRKQLITEIKKTQKRGFSMSIEEFLPGLITIGAPLVNQNTGKCLGGISFDFSTIQHNPEEIEEKYSGLVMEASRTLSKLLPEGSPTPGDQ